MSLFFYCLKGDNLKKICLYCNKEYETNRDEQKYCSRQCSHRSMMMRIECECETCGKTVSIKKSEYEKNEHHFCSRECHYNCRKETVYCQNCGKEFISDSSKKRKYCCHKCAIEYISHHQKTNKEILVCKYCGKEFEAHVSDRRSFCSKPCAYNWKHEHPCNNEYQEGRRQKGERNFFNKYNNINTTTIVIGQYVNAKTKIKCKCSMHGQEFEMIPSHILRGASGCSRCNLSIGENKIKDILIKNNINFVQQKRFDDCKDKYKLAFDFYLPDHNIVIEYDGEQHFRTVTYGKMSEEQALKNLETTQKHDAIKNKYCERNNIQLIRIKYTEKENIEKIIKDKIINQ